ncbi:hypothetical protein QYF36_025938 [Acer negundo]|nr:hypothetical protein QYF36_025938 [Acer negundo]
MDLGLVWGWWVFPWFGFGGWVVVWWWLEFRSDGSHLVVLPLHSLTSNFVLNLRSICSYKPSFTVLLFQLARSAFLS